ncbi:tail fiber domain-containing protein, partial [Jeotgalibacillus marinus]
LPLYTDDTRLDDVVDTINNNSGKWSSVDDSNFPDIEPPVPINVQATGAFRSIIIEWDFVPDLYIANYEVFASQVKGFHPDSSNLVFRGKTSICSYNADVNEQWYFRVRAVNTHGTQSDFSKEVSDTTARIISDDILFGEEIAEELRELSENAEILAGGTVGIDKMKEEALEAIQETAKKYTDEEIQEAEEAINKELAEKAGLNYVDGEFSLVNSELSEMLGDINLISGDVSGIDSRVDSLQNTSDDLRSRVSENEEELLANDGRVTTVERDIDEVEGTLYTTINSLSNVENTIENQQTQIDANATEINLKASEGALNTVTGDVREVQSELSVQAGQIEAKAESAELTIVDGKVAGVQENLASLEVSVDGISTSVESLQVDLDGLEIGGRNLLRNSLLVDNHSNNSNIYPVDKEVFEDYHRYTSREGASNPLINLYNSIPSTDITDGSWQDNDITASVNVRTDLEDAYIRIRLYDTQNTDDTILETVVVPVPTGIWTRISITAPNVSQNLKDDSIVRVMLQASNSSGSAVSMVGKYLDIGGFKIEKGNKATDWTPAPEDIDSSIENVQQYASSIDQKADSISLEVSELEQTVDGNTASISNAESSITQLATSIVLKAEQDQVDTIDGEVTTVKSQVSELTVDIDGIYTSVSSLEIDLDDLGTRVESSESSITQLSDSIDLTVKELDIVDGRMTEAEASLKVQAGQIELKVEEDEIISSINQTAGSVKIKAEMIELDGDVYLDGGTTYIRDGAIGSAAIKNGVIENAHLGTAIIKTAQIAEGAIEKAQIGEAQIDSSHIGELSADKIKSGTLDASNITIFGGTTNDYTKIEGSFFESRGKFERTWRGLTETHDIKMKFERGYLRARNDSKNWSLYFSDYGISTFADGSGDDSSSGTIAFHDKSYSDTAMGLTMHSNSGVIGLRSEKNKIMLDANSTVYIDSEVANVYIRPLRTSRVGNNEFKFSVKLNSSPSDTDGWIAYGSPGTNFACGLRFKKTTVGDPTVYVTNGNGDKNTGALEANKVKAREIGNLSSRTFKTNIEKMNDNGLDLVNQLTIVKYDLISDLEKGEFNNRQVGLISEDSPSVATTDGIAINMYKLVSYNVKATQELSTKSNDQDKRINDLKIENQLLKARIQTLEEAI